MSTAAAGRVTASVRRYAPLVALVAAVALVVAVAPSRPGPGPDSLSGGQLPDAGQSAVAGGAGEGQVGGPPLEGQSPSGTAPTPASEAAPNGVPSTGAGTTGRPGEPGSVGTLPCVPRPLNAALPCKPGWAGSNNGGATAHNVTAGKLVLVWYVVYANESTKAIAAGQGKEITEDDIRADTAALEKFVNKNWQTYGRMIDVVPYFGSHDVTDDAGLKAEAVEIDQQLKAFAVAAAQMPVTLSLELSRRGVINFNTYQQLSSFYAKSAPFAYSVFGDADLLNAFTAEYAGKRLKGRVAEFAGNGSNRSVRKFGVCFEGVLKASADDLVARLRKVGIEPVVASYGSDISQAQQQALNIISQFRQAGVTTIINIGNVVSPVFLTSNADTQRYYPEYLVNGYQAHDTEEAARLYSQTQWSHAFGFTQLTVRNKFEESQGYQAARQGDPSYTPTTVVIAEYLALQQILNGIETAGPQLTPQGFAAGLRSVPPTPPTPKQPKLSYGSTGPGPFTGRDDVAEIWWNPDATETFDDKKGAYMRVNGGRRVDLGGFPSTVPAVFR